jgi:hypothetical protein
LARRNPYAALTKWQQREGRLPEGGGGLSKAFFTALAAELSKGDLVRSAAAIQQLPDKLRERLEGELKKAAANSE